MSQQTGWSKVRKSVQTQIETLKHDWITSSLLILTGIFLVFSLNYLLHGSVYFFTDIGRDFLLMDDVLAKKVVLIGARTSLMGVFHGPIWLYLNLPAFVIGHGSPVVVAWFWFGCSLLFLGSLFWVANRLFDRRTAAIATVLMSIHLIYLQKAFTNPAGTLWLLPIFIYTFLQYWKTAKPKYLLWHLFIAGLVIQFEMLVGVPLLLLTGLLCLGRWWQTKKFVHILCFAILAIPLSTFVLFDMRHDFMQFRSLISYVTDQVGSSPFGWGDMIHQRFDIITRDGLGIFSSQYHILTHLNTLALVVLLGYFVTTIKKRSRWDTKIAILAFYFVGVICFSLVFKSPLQFHYWWPLFPLPLMMFGAILPRLSFPILRVAYVLIFIGALAGGFYNGWNEVQYAQASIGKVQNDWQFLTTNFSPVFAGNETEFGYFLYAPDVYAYQQKYTMVYLTKIHPEKTVHVYAKAPVTYLVIAPPTGTGVEMTQDKWRKEKLRITKAPDQIMSQAAGYTIEKYNFSPAEVKQEVDSTILDWIYFR